MQKIVAKAGEIKKALAAAAGALVALQAYGGWGNGVDDWLKTAVAVLGVFGITYVAKNNAPADQNW